jgi:phosphohistidine phosphatase
MKLYCVRHGEAYPVETHPDRPLTPAGERYVEKVANQMKRSGIDIASILHSNALRTEQTAKILGENLKAPIVRCNSILNERNEIYTILEMIRSFQEDTMLVGHLPFLNRLINALVLGDENYYPIVQLAPGAVVCLEFYEHYRWVIQWVLNSEIV